MARLDPSFEQQGQKRWIFGAHPLCNLKKHVLGKPSPNTFFILCPFKQPLPIPYISFLLSHIGIPMLYSFFALVIVTLPPNPSEKAPRATREGGYTAGIYIWRGGMPHAVGCRTLSKHHFQCWKREKLTQKQLRGRDARDLDQKNAIFNAEK